MSDRDRTALQAPDLFPRRGADLEALVQAGVLSRGREVGDGVGVGPALGNGGLAGVVGRVVVDVGDAADQGVGVAHITHAHLLARHELQAAHSAGLQRAELELKVDGKRHAGVWPVRQLICAGCLMLASGGWTESQAAALDCMNAIEQAERVKSLPCTVSGRGTVSGKPSARWAGSIHFTTLTHL